MILAAAAIDLINHLKKYSDGWVFEPLVVKSDNPLRHSCFTTIITRPNNHTSPYDFYVDNAPKGISTLIKAAKAGHYPRLIEMRLDPGPTAKILLLYWRVNGWKQNQVSHRFSNFYSHRVTPVQQSNEISFRVYAIERVTKTKRKTYVHRDVLDISAIDSADIVARLIMATFEKSLQKAYGGGRREKLKKYTEHLAVMLEGRNYHYDGHRFGGEIVYGQTNLV